MTDFDDLHDDYDDDPIEAYCVRCRDTIEMEDPHAVWTRKGAPGTRGICPICGTTVFRMGRTDAHRALKKPGAVRVSEGAAQTRQALPTLAANATYIACADADAVFAHKLADDLNNMGIPAWVPRTGQEDVAWAGGVHPALNECTRLLVILSAAVLDDEPAATAWGYFRTQKKRIVVAQTAPVDVPDDLRRAPRVDFQADYRPALRQLVQALAE